MGLCIIMYVVVESYVKTGRNKPKCKRRFVCRPVLWPSRSPDHPSCIIPYRMNRPYSNILVLYIMILVTVDTCVDVMGEYNTSSRDTGERKSGGRPPARVRASARREVFENIQTPARAIPTFVTTHVASSATPTRLYGRMVQVVDDDDVCFHVVISPGCRTDHGGAKRTHTLAETDRKDSRCVGGECG